MIIVHSVPDGGVKEATSSSIRRFTGSKTGICGLTDWFGQIELHA